ncbi:cyclic nucleotide-binding domain-containing protein [Allopontixanthobacter sp.]|uniref:cyclic nucleotide-binding domain-containing protein n=1 Tax=Allopontixanthobacter sp. TaxID=2906452 RepID=UPI002AB828EB|nr:cyclic nucleotide-binding domain-containing protein [Allopontixanthobacter sp.]MDZ4308790.1 cyclic nucleotide-binding domain-containing protein [Allopontixanthobacter sp.]
MRELKAEEPLFHQGDEVNYVYTVATGSLRLYRILFDGRRQITGFALPGEFLGISIDESHEVTAEALEPSRIWSFPRSRFDDFVEENPLLKDSLLVLARQEIAAAQLQFIVLGRKTAMERVASFILYLLARFERLTGHPMDRVILPMSRADIADYLGLTKETVSRVFGQLRNSRIMRLETLTCIQVLDRHALKALADGDDA